MTSRKLPFHYAWVIVATGTLCIFASLGLGRFALGMLLPSMVASLGLTYSQIGFISTANFVGYLVSVLVSGFLVGRLGARKLIFAALLLVGVSMCLVGISSNFITVSVLYTLTGIGSGASNIPMMALVSTWFSRKKRGKAAGFIVIGSGFAILLSGWMVPAVNSIGGDVGWRYNWILIGLIVVAIGFICYALIRNTPAGIGLSPYGIDESPPRRLQQAGSLYRMRIIYHLGAIYFLFGYTYVIYVTFIVTSFVNEMGFTEVRAGELWSWVGVLSLLSGPVFGMLSDKLGRKAGFAIVFTMQAIAYMLAALKLPGVFVYLTIGFFGVAAWSIPSIMAAAVGDYVGAERAPQAFGIVTFIFALGQIIGPAVAGMLAESTGGFSTSFAMASALALVAAIMALMLKSQAAHEEALVNESGDTKRMDAKSGR